MNATLQFVGICKQYGSVTALTDIELTIEPGSAVALLGPNGAGKSTLFGCLLGWTRPTAGQIRWGGKPVDAAMRRRCGYTQERVALYTNRTVWENGLFFAKLRGQDGPELERQLARLNLLDLRNRKAGQLSKGMLQRLGLAIALCGAPELLVLDEPFNGLDPAHLADLGQVLQEEQARGATLLISTHTISAVAPLASHVAILLHGRLAAFGDVTGLEQRYPEACSLEAIYHRVACQRQHHQEEIAA